jgi:protein phosphatase 1 regulatory subunit 11
MLRTAPPPSDASRTITLTAPDAPPEGAGDARGTDEPQLTLRLRGSPSPAPPTRQRRGPRVAWGDDVVDNEGCGKKSSKGACVDLLPRADGGADLMNPVCCIYHKPRGFDESSGSESDDNSSSSSDEDDGGGSGHEGDDGRAGRVGRGHGHNHHHHQDKNAYERIPRARGKAKTDGEYPRRFSGEAGLMLFSRG